MLKTPSVFSLIAASAMLAAPVALTAQDASDRFAGSERARSKQTPEEMAATDTLNRTQAGEATQQNMANTAARQSFEQAQRDREETIARQAADHRAEVERLEREHAAAMTRWEADVAACKAGDRTRCAMPTSPL